jgi:hypothetical protein
MADQHASQLHQAFSWRPWHVGDPAVLLENILGQVEAEQRKQIMGHYLDAVAATLEANLKFVQGVRSVVGGGKR